MELDEQTDTPCVVSDEATIVSSKTKMKTTCKTKKKNSTKLITKKTAEPFTPPNVILHLKCMLKDLEQYNFERTRIVKDPLQYSPEVPPEIKAYDDSDVFSSALISSAFCFNQEYNCEKRDNEPVSSGLGLSGIVAYPFTLCNKCKEQTETSFGTTKHPVETQGCDYEKTLRKLKELKIQFYTNDCEPMKKSACMWCSYDFDNEPFYLPKQETFTNFIVYGCFCSPECATGYLFKERIDDTAKFERYHLLNKIYRSSCIDNENIHPAPNPYILLDRYLGNLTIQEYRDLLKKGRSFDIVEKPLSRILPELHADFNSSGGCNTYKVKRSNGSSTM